MNNRINLRYWWCLMALCFTLTNFKAQVIESFPIEIPSSTVFLTSQNAPAKPKLGLPFGHTTQVTSLTILPSGELVSTGEDKVVHFWDLNNLKWLRSTSNQLPLRYQQLTSAGIAIAYPIDPTNDLVFVLDPCSKTSLNCTTSFNHAQNNTYTGISSDGLYALAENQLVPGCAGWGDTIALEFTATGFTASGNHLYHLEGEQMTRWAYPGLEKVDQWQLNGVEELSLTFFRNDRYLYGYSYPMGDELSLQRVWDMQNGRLIVDTTFPLGTKVTDIAPAGDYLLLLTIDDYTGESVRTRYNVAEKKIDLTYGAPVTSQDFFNPLGGSIYSPDGRYVISPSTTGNIYLYSADTAEEFFVLRSGVKTSVNLNLTDNGTRLHLAGDPSNTSETTTTIWEWAQLNRVQPSSIPNDEFAAFFNPQPVATEPLSYFTSPTATANAPSSQPTGAGLGNRSDITLHLAGIYEEHDWGCRFYLTQKQGNQVLSGQSVNYQNNDLKAAGNLRYRSSAVFENSQIAVGTMSGTILLFDGAGNYLFSLEGHQEEVTSLQFFKEGNRLVSTSGDGKTKIWNLEQKKELATLLLIGSKDWVVLGPNNLFDASPAALDRLYFLVETGNYTNEVIELGQMKDRYYEPGLLQKLLGFSEKPLRSVTGLETIELYPHLSAEIAGDVLHVSLTPINNAAIGRVTLYVNGKELDYDIRSNTDDQRIKVPLNTEAYRKYYLHDNVLSIRAYNAEESLHSKDLELAYTYPAGPKIVPRGSDGAASSLAFSEEEARNARLYVVCVGTSDYANDAMDLTYPDLDAIVMSQAFQSVGNELFGTNGTVEVHCLTTNQSADTEHLQQAGIKWQYAEKNGVALVLEGIRNQARAQDVLVVYLSGHGKTMTLNGKEQFYYLTHETISAQETDQSILSNSAISSAELADWMKRIPAYKQVLILDACNSGQLISDFANVASTRELNSSQIRALDRMSSRTGTYLIAGSAADMVSYEANKYGQGLLTYALLKGIMGASLTADESAGELKNYYVGVTELFEYAQQQVAELAQNIGGIQQPQISYPLKAGSFPLGIYNTNTIISIGVEKPVLVRSHFQAEKSFADDLNLEATLAEFFQAETRKGKDAKLVYLNAIWLPNAYQLRGRYEEKEDGLVHIRANLIREGYPPLPLAIKPTTKDFLADDVFTAVLKALRNAE